MWGIWGSCCFGFGSGLFSNPLITRERERKREREIRERQAGDVAGGWGGDFCTFARVIYKVTGSWEPDPVMVCGYRVVPVVGVSLGFHRV